MARTNRPVRSRRCQPPKMEGLEARELLAGDLPSILKIEADNRGQVFLTLSANLNSDTINATSVRAFTSGNDKLLGTADDTAVSVSDFVFDRTARVMRFTATVPANTRYRVVLDSTRITGDRGTRLDGEFNGAGVISGDGVAGGDLVFFTRSPAADVARVTTFAGTIDIDLIRDRAPITVANFLSYANDGSYDNNMFHRNAKTNGVPFVVQGGGFKATTGFPSVPQRAQIQNEFGISNTRGTIAMAKLGGNPNSATNQFFFNLGDNSANLDNQNGGFTVFARVRDAAGLAVMDALSAFQNFNASSQNSAFDDLPVRNLTDVQVRGSATPDDVITINRIALLVDISAEAGQQANTAGSVTVTGTGGQVVTFLDLTGNGFGSTDFATVRFGSGNTISSITFTKDFNGSAAIVVTGASRVGAINDQRRTANGTVGYVAIQDGTLGALNLRGSLVGANVNGFVVASGFELPSDIDGDGVTNDLAAVFAPGTGATSAITIRGSLTGGIRLGGALLRTVVTGDANQADIRTGGTATEIADYRFGSVDNTSINTAQRINSLNAANWRVSETTRKAITAPTIRTLSITGAGGTAGVFESNLTLTGPVQGSPSSALTLGSASIKGGVFAGTWNITGDMGATNLGPTVDDFTLNVTGGDARSLVMGRASSSNITVAGNLASFRASEWFTGRVRAGTVDRFTVSRGGQSGGDGSFEGTLETTTTNATTAINTVSIGSLRNATIDARTVLNSFTAGPATGSVIGGRSGINTLKLGDISSTNISAQNQGRNISVRSWDGGTLLGGTVRSLNVAGNARFNGTNVGAVLEMRIGGNLTSTLSTGGGFNWRIGGDMLDSNISLTFQNTLSSLLSLGVSGAMVNSNFRTVQSLNTANIGRMENSGLYVGAPTNQNGLPPTAANTNDAARIDTLRIFGRGSGDAFVNSFVVTGRLRNATIVRPDLDQGGTIQGVAANRITSITVNTGRSAVTFNNPSGTITTLGDFRIQLNPAATT